MNTAEKIQMNPILKKNWVDALRSGKYKQGMGELYNELGNNYCVIGIFNKINNYSNESSVGYDPLKAIIGQDAVDELWGMNDIKDKTFDQLADFIEENY